MTDPLDVARNLVRLGVPLFVAPPCPSDCRKHAGVGHGGTGFHLPGQWQTSTPTPSVVDRWRPGWALCAVMGSTFDGWDSDPRHGGSPLPANVRSYGRARTPSGGTHSLIATLNVASRDALLPGVDLKAGKRDGEGRGFLFIAPTVKTSKVTGEPRAYEWEVEPVAPKAGDTSGAWIAALAGARHETTADLIAGSGEHSGPIPEGQQWARLTSYSGYLLARFSGLGQHEHEALMRRRWQDCEPHASGYRWPWEDCRASVVEPTWRKYRRGDDDGFEESSSGGSLGERFLTTFDLDALPDPEWLVRDWLEMDSANSIVGRSGHKKSFVALDLACHAALGLPWHGYRVRKTPVVYVVAEGARGFRKRVRAWEKRYGQRAAGLYILPEPVQAISDDWQGLIEACRDVEAGFVVLDTQARVTVGLEENSATDMGRFVDRIEALRAATGACVTGVHHMGHSAGRARGSSALYAAWTSEISVDKSDDDIVTVSSSKEKDSADNLELRFRSERHVLGVDTEGEEIASLTLTRITELESVISKENVNTEAKRLIVKAAHELHPTTEGATKPSVMRFVVRSDSNPTGVSRSSAFRAWKELVDLGRLVPSEGGRYLWTKVDELLETESE